MRRIEAAGLVGASREEVWELYDDIAGSFRWMPFVRAVEAVPGPARVGTVYREHRRTMGIPTIERWEVTELRRPVTQVRVSELGRMQRTLQITFEARGSGTLVHIGLELRARLPGPLGWAYEHLAAIPGDWAIRASIQGAKQVFEGRATR